MARTPKTQPTLDTADANINQEAINGAMDAMRDQAQEEAAQIAHGSRIVGGALMAGLHKKFSAAAEVSMFVQLRELPLTVVRKIPISAPGETSATAESLDELCRSVFGRPYNSMAEEAQNLQALGDASYNLASRLGLNRSALRSCRALPPESLETVRLAISNGSSKAEVLSVIEDLAEKVQTTQAQVLELKAEKEAADRLVEAKNKTIDKLQREVKRFDRLPPDEKVKALQDDATNTMNVAAGSIEGVMRQAFLALVNSGDERHQHDVFLAGLAGQVQAALNQLRAEFSLPDVSEAASQIDAQAWAAVREGLAASRANKGGV